MTITYPLTAPAELISSRVRWWRMSATAISESPFNYKQQAQRHDGERWGVEFSMDRLERADAAPIMAFLMKLRGREGTFLYGDYLMSSPLGAAGGTPKVNGGSQTGFTVITDGWPNSTQVLKAGDLFQIDNALYMNLVDATTNGSGQVTLDIWPSLRGHADNADIVTSNPKCLLRLVDNSVSIIDADQSKLYAISFTAEEAR